MDSKLTQLPVVGRFVLQSLKITPDELTISATTGAGYGPDDYALFLTCLPVIGVTISAYMELANGLGQDIWQLTVQEVQLVLKVGSTSKSTLSFC